MAFFLSKEYRCDGKSRYCSCQICQQTTCYGVPCIFNIHTSEIYGQYIESSVRCAL